MLKFSQSQPLLNEAWEDLGTYNYKLVAVIEAIAWASYKKFNEELHVQKVDYETWAYVDVSKSAITEDIATLINDHSTTCRATINDHYVRITNEIV